MLHGIKQKKTDHSMEVVLKFSFTKPDLKNNLKLPPLQFAKTNREFDTKQFESFKNPEIREKMQCT